MSGYSIQLEQATLENTNFRKVLYTAPHSQLVLMCLQPMEEIGIETHAEHDQFIRVESGSGKAIIGGEEFVLADGVAIIIPAGSAHNVINTSATELMKIYTVYTPPEHKDGKIHVTKADALSDPDYS